MSIQTGTLPTPIGEMHIGVVSDHVCLLEFNDRPMLPSQIDRIESLYQTDLLERHHYLFDIAELQLKEYFNNKRTVFDLPLDYRGSPFQKIVWESLMTIPYGKTRSYAQQSELIENKKAIRAMAKANGDNRLAILHSMPSGNWQ